jgi:hypothetical protein
MPSCETLTPNDAVRAQDLMLLRETSQDCFFGLVQQHLAAVLPLIYTPTVGDACRQWSSLLRRPQGVYISINDLVSHSPPSSWTGSMSYFLMYVHAFAGLHACRDNGHVGNPQGSQLLALCRARWRPGWRTGQRMT